MVEGAAEPLASGVALDVVVAALTAVLDVVAAPVPPLGHLDTTTVDSMYRNASTYSAMTSVANMTGQPAISLPLAVGTDNLPLGIQLVAAFGREDLLLQVAREIELAHPWSTAPLWPPRSL